MSTGQKVLFCNVSPRGLTSEMVGLVVEPEPVHSRIEVFVKRGGFGNIDITYRPFIKHVRPA